MIRQQNDQEELRAAKRSNNIFGIRIIGNKIQDNKLGHNKSKNQHLTSPDHFKSVNQHDEHQKREVSTKGIQVLSSRQSSNDRPRPTSKSNQCKKQQRQIKSQSNISEFDSAKNSKEVSIEKFGLSQCERSSICQMYEQQFKQAILRQSADYEIQLNQLRLIIDKNQQRINNLINTLNVMMEAAEKKQKIIDKLEGRMKSIQKYQEQCYEYNIHRCNDTQALLRNMTHEIEAKTSMKTVIENKCSYISCIVRDIFMIQRQNLNSQHSTFGYELKNLEQQLEQLGKQIDTLRNINHQINSHSTKIESLDSHVVEVKQILRNHTFSIGKIENPYGWIERQELSAKVQCVDAKLNHLQQLKAQLQKSYQKNEQKSKQAIWELSNLLNKKERDLQKATRERQELRKYNQQIENKLIEARFRENSLKLNLEAQTQSSKSDEFSRIIAENEVFREKYGEAFRHSQLLEDLNCKNNISIRNYQKEVSQLKQNIQRMKKEMQGKDETIENNIRNHYQSLETLQVQSEQCKGKCLQLQRKVAQLTEERQSIKTEYNKIYRELLTSQKELEDQQLYAQHLEQENQKLSGTIHQYAASFDSQSCAFKSTIELLRQENHLLRIQQQANACKSANQSNKSGKGPLQIKQVKNGLNDQKQPKLNQNWKIFLLKKAFSIAGYLLPVPCEIDSTGYLKHYERGTYIIDENQNLFDLTAQEVSLAVSSQLIQLFQ